MSSIKIIVTPSDIEAQIAEAIENATLSGMGADGTSEYEITEVDVTGNGDGTYDVIVQCDRVEGKFVSNDDLFEEIQGNVDDLSVTIELAQA
jgi:hypothetical protein